MGDYITAQSEGVHVVKVKEKEEKKLRQFVRLVECAENKWNEIRDQGVFKVEAPREWTADQANFRDVNHHFMMQYETWEPCVDPDETGCFVRVTEDGNQVTKEQFRVHATQAAWQPVPGQSGSRAISGYFRRRGLRTEERLVTGTVAGSRFSDYSDNLNLRNFKSILNVGTLQNGQLREEPGITTVYGSFGSTVPLQTGYMGLYTGSYNHGGKPRVWLVIHAEQRNITRFEQVLRRAFRQDFIERGVNHCRNPLQHKKWIVAPSFLRRHNIKYSTVVQRAGDIVIILPKAYFMGFNCGYNMVESVQFATPRWIDIGKSLRPRMCDCRPVWLNPDDFDAALIEYQRRRRVERANRQLTEENERLRMENAEERQRCPLRHPHRLRQRPAPYNAAERPGTSAKVAAPYDMRSKENAHPLPKRARVSDSMPVPPYSASSQPALTTTAGPQDFSEPTSRAVPPLIIRRPQATMTNAMPPPTSPATPSTSAHSVLARPESLHGATFDARLLGICEITQTVINEAVEKRIKELEKELKTGHTKELNALTASNTADMDRLRTELTAKHTKSERERKELHNAYQKESTRNQELMEEKSKLEATLQTRQRAAVRAFEGLKAKLNEKYGNLRDAAKEAHRKETKQLNAKIKDCTDKIAVLQKSEEKLKAENGGLQKQIDVSTEDFERRLETVENDRDGHKREAEVLKVELAKEKASVCKRDALLASKEAKIGSINERLQQTMKLINAEETDASEPSTSSQQK